MFHRIGLNASWPRKYFEMNGIFGHHANILSSSLHSVDKFVYAPPSPFAAGSFNLPFTRKYGKISFACICCRVAALDMLIIYCG